MLTESCPARADRRRWRACSSRGGRSICIVVAAADEAAETLGFDWQLDRHGAALRGGLTIGTGMLFGLFPACTARVRIWRPRSRARPGSRRAARGPRHGSARRWRRRRLRCRWRCWSAPGCSRRACATSAAWISGINVDHVATFGVSPGAERLHRRAIESSCSSGSRTSWRRCPA